MSNCETKQKVIAGIPVKIKRCVNCNATNPADLEISWALRVRTAIKRIEARRKKVECWLKNHEIAIDDDKKQKNKLKYNKPKEPIALILPWASKRELLYDPERIRKIKQNNSNRTKVQYKADPMLRLNSKMAAGISCAFAKDKKRKSGQGKGWENYVGYKLIDLKTHLEALFQDGMTWDNYGKWHIDHIRPISSFSFDSPDHPEFKECWGLENLQPLWAVDNLRKHNKWTH